MQYLENHNYVESRLYTRIHSFHHFQVFKIKKKEQQKNYNKNRKNTKKKINSFSTTKLFLQIFVHKHLAAHTDNTFRKINNKKKMEIVSKMKIEKKNCMMDS